MQARDGFESCWPLGGCRRSSLPLSQTSHYFFPLVSAQFHLVYCVSTLFSHSCLFHSPVTPSPGVGGCTVKQAEPLISKSSKHDGYQSKLLSPTGKTSERNHLLFNRMNKAAI